MKSVAEFDLAQRTEPRSTGRVKMNVATVRTSFLRLLVNRIELWIKEHIVAEGYQDESGFHYREPPRR